MDVILHDSLVQGAVRTLGLVLLAVAFWLAIAGMRTKSVPRRALYLVLAIFLAFASFTVDSAAPLLPVG